MNDERFLVQLGIVDFKLVNNEYLCNCIFCGDSKSNLQINFNKKLYHCWVCGEGGSLVSLVMKVHDLDRPDAIRLFKLDVVDVDYELGQLNEYIQQQTIRVYNYAKYLYRGSYNEWQKRNITRQSWKDFSLGYDPYTDRLVIPIFNQDSICIGLSKRAINPSHQPKYLNTTKMNKSSILYGFDSIDISKDNIVITEGMIDCIVTRQLGFNSVAMMGLDLHNKQIGLIWDNFANVILMLDNDKAGQDAKRGKFDLRGNKVGPGLVEKLELNCNVFETVYDTNDPGELVSISQIGEIHAISII